MRAQYVLREPEAMMVVMVVIRFANPQTRTAENGHLMVVVEKHLMVVVVVDHLMVVVGVFPSR